MKVINLGLKTKAIFKGNLQKSNFPYRFLDFGFIIFGEGSGATNETAAIAMRLVGFAHNSDFSGKVGP